MNWKDFGAALVEFLKNIWLWMIVLARRHSMALVGSAIVVLALMTLWSLYRDWRTTEFVLLSGPGGSASMDDARLIKNRIEGQSSTLGAAYRVTLEETEGFEEVRRRVNSDETGRLIGFAHDGFGNAANVRVLLPLDNNYVHILARRGFINEVFDEKEPVPKKITFAELMERGNILKPGRISLGPPDSGTRQLAELVLERHLPDVSDIGRCQANGIVSWHDMRAGLNNGSIDLAFYGGRLDAGIIKNIAADGSSVMLGLDGDRDAITQGQQHLMPETFKANSYSNGGFCPTEIETFASRRVLLCSSKMSEPTAFFLASNAREAMRVVVPDIDWVNPPPDAPRSHGLTYRIHPGADRLRTGSALAGVPWNSNYVLLTLALWIATELVQSANKRLRKPSADAPEQTDGKAPLNGPSAVPSSPAASTVAAAAMDPVVAESASRDAYDSIEREIYDDVFALIALPPLSKSQQANWMRKVKVRRKSIEKLREEGRLLEKHSEALLTAVDKLAAAVTHRNVQSRQKKPTNPAVSPAK
jgi:hypothetical protein